MGSIFTSSSIEGYVYGDTDRGNLLLWRGILSHDEMLDKDPDYIANLIGDSYIFDYLPIQQNNHHYC